MRSFLLQSITVTFFGVLVAFLGREANANSDCVDLPSCSNVPVSYCSDPLRMQAIRENCKALCGLCPSKIVPQQKAVKNQKHPKATKNRAIKRKTKSSPKSSPKKQKQKPVMKPQQQKEQCVDNDSCKYWVKNGYCQSPYRTAEEKKKTCPNACNLCNSNPTNPTNNPTNSNGMPYEFFAQSLDETVKPCDDFYKFACGKYQKEHVPRNGMSYSRFIDHTRLVEDQLMKTVFTNDSTKSQAVGLMRKFRDACMNTQAIEADQTTTLQSDLKAMQDIPMLTPGYTATTFKLTDTLIEMNKRSGNNFLFNIDLVNDAKGQPTLLFSPSNLIIKNANDYTDPAQKKKIDALKQFLAEIMTQIGNDMGSGKTFQDVKTAIDAVNVLENKLAQEFVNEKMDDEATMATTLQNPKKLSDFENLLKNANADLQVDLNKYLQANTLLADADIQKLLATDPPVFIHTEALFQKIMPILTATGQEMVFADYLFIQYVLKQVGYLDSRFSAAANRFAYKLDGSTHTSTRDQDCFEMIRMNFPLALDHQYNVKFLSKESEQSAQKVMDRMKEGFGALIKKAQWLDAPDQQYAIRKLSAVKASIGEIDEAKSRKKLDAVYAGLTFDSRDKFLGMATKVAQAKGQIKYAKLVKANAFSYDKSKSADNIGTNFIREQNELFVPAAILQSPFLNNTLPASVSYGAIGFLYGFGLSHGFDDLGRRFDLNGVERSWWDKQTKKAYKKKKQCLVDVYDSLTEPLTNQNVDGQKTLRENIADSGAIRGAFEAYKAYEKAMPTSSNLQVPGFQKYSNDQTFFIGYATMMCASFDQAYQDQLMKNDEFAPSQFRVNTVLANFEEFSNAFKCAATDKMVDSRKCSVW